MLQNTVKIAKDPGVLFSLLHASTFLVTSGASSPAFAIAMGSLGLSVGFSAVQKKVIPNNLTIPNGAALTTNGIILSSITALSIASSNVPTAIISGLYAISNTSKGLEMGGKKNLKTLGNYLLPKNDLVSRTIKNTAFSAEFIASTGAFAVGYNGIGPMAGFGMGAATATLLTLGTSNNDIDNPTWKKIPGATAAFNNAVKIKEKITSIPSTGAPIGDVAMARYVMGGISVSYGVASFLSHKSGFGNEILALGHVFSAAANIIIGNFQRQNDYHAQRTTSQPVSTIAAPSASVA